MASQSKQKRVDEPLLRLLIREEGWKAKPYRCTKGKLTIGVGHNLDVEGLCDEAIIAQLEHDVRKAKRAARRICGLWFDELHPVRQDVLVSMVFQLGEAGTRQFTQTLMDMSMGNFMRAADRIRKSKWASQTPGRVERLAKILERASYDGIIDEKIG